jgi:tRNA G18 (ribose-2'-O)-methylase SpoU
LTGRAAPTAARPSVSGVTNGPLDDFVGLTDVALRRRSEPAHGLFVAEGVRVANRALEAGYVVRSLVVTPERRGRPDVDELVAAVASAGGAVHVVEGAALLAVAGFDVHRGVLASFARRPLPSILEVASPARTLAVLEAVVDHTNVGAIIRSAAALGVDGIVLDPRCADPLYRRAIRTSMGAVFAVPYARSSTWPGGLKELRDMGFRVLALTPGEASVDLAEVRVDADERVALVLGAEGAGLSRAALAASEGTVSIAMSHGVDSLNVAASAALAFWGVTRARGS